MPLKSLLSIYVLLAAVTQADPSPSPRIVNLVDQQFGLSLPDPYRWMEGDKNSEFVDWLRGEGASARVKLDQLASLAQWRDKFGSLGKGRITNSAYDLREGRLFFLRSKDGQPSSLMMHSKGQDTLLFDPNTGNGARASSTNLNASPDGRFVAINVDKQGDEITQIVVHDTKTGTLLADKIERVWGELDAKWLPTGKAFTYVQMAADHGSGKDQMTGMRVRLHRLGSNPTTDPVLLEHGGNKAIGLTKVEFPHLSLPPKSKWAMAWVTAARPEVRLCVTRQTEALQPDAKWKCVADYEDNVTSFALHGSMLYLLSSKSAPNGRILALDLDKPVTTLANAQVVIPEFPDDQVSGLIAAKDALYVHRMSNGLSQLLRVAYDGGKHEVIHPPLSGAISEFVGTGSTEGVAIAVQAWTKPAQSFFYNPSQHSFAATGLNNIQPTSYPDVVADEVEAISKDGTKVPLTVLHRVDAKRDGSNLAILDGYGGYGESYLPWYSSLTLEWVNAGHVYAFAHTRGGSEKGRNWWVGGKGELKYKGVEDFIACATELGKLGWSTPDRVAAKGESMGGVLVGGALTAQPSAFGAAVLHAGILNPLRILAGVNGENQIPELGDPRTESGYRSIAAMDPYVRLREGVSYPPVLLSVGLNDSRVPSWETGKFGAKLRQVSKGQQTTLIRVADDAGHTAESLNEQAAETADTYAFLESVLKH
jgi:prolyl oligopeptidase